MKTARERERRQKKIAAGYCHSCTTRLADKGFKSCSYCRAKLANYQAARYRRKRREGYCHGCHRVKPPLGQACCDPCRIRLNENGKRWRAKPQNKIKIRANYLRLEHRISLDEYNHQLLAQGRRCAICGTIAEQLSRPLAVDHSHKTGHRRGLLCDFCNKGLGQFRDDITLLAKAIEYLSSYLKEEDNPANLSGIAGGS